MILQRFEKDGEPKDYDDFLPHEQSLLHLMSCVNGKYKSDYWGVQKTQSIRFTTDTYPKIKALADMSGNSINVIVNDLVKLAYGVVMENLGEKDSDILFAEECRIRKEWLDDYQPKEQK